MSSLGQALSQSRLSRPDVIQAQKPPLREESDLEVRVLVIYTGGTIGMKENPEGSKPVPGALHDFLHTLPILHDKKYAQDTYLHECYPKFTLVLPLSKQKLRVVYTILEYSTLLDSSNMTPDAWAKIGKYIEKYYEQYNGFVVLHGTDTMAYTSSALSFMCENLRKPVVLTGSQVPIYELRNDGRDNLLEALLVAGQSKIPEVCLYFQQKLYRGNRVTKVDAGSFNAFTSPNLRPLANLQADVKINWDIVWQPDEVEKFTVSTELNSNVGVLRFFPGIPTDTVKAFLQAPIAGIVFETYGCGNAPNHKDLLDVIKKATDEGVIIINCTQCLRGMVKAKYETGEDLYKAGVIPGYDMTPEAALSKLSYVLAKYPRKDEDKKKRKEMMTTNLRGELTDDPDGQKFSLSDSRFIQVIAKSLSSSCKEELDAIGHALTPSLACAAAKVGDIEALEAISKMSSNLSMADYDGRTPLHIAACEGHLKVVEYLLSKGATVYARDRFGDTPLRSAVFFRHKEVVKLLRKTGAHFSRDEMVDARKKLRSLAENGDLEGLEILQLAGAEVASATGRE